MRRPSKRKEKRIKSVLRRQGEIAEKIAELMPSISPSRWGNTRADSVFHRWVDKFFPDNNGLRSHDANQVAYKVSENFESYRSNGYNGKKPNYSAENQRWIRFCNCGNSVKYECNDGKWGVRLPLEPRDHEWFRLKVGDYQEHYLTKDEARLGDAELVKEDGRYVLNQAVSLPMEETDYDSKTFVGIDMGLNKIAVVVALDTEGNYIGGPFGNSPFFDGGEVRHYRDKLNVVRRKIQEGGGETERIRELKENYPRHINHYISRKVVDFAEELENPVIKMENLRHIRTRLNQEDRSSYESRRLNSWSFGELQTFIEYKAEMKGIKVNQVNPKNTSRECPKCGYVSGDNREGINFKCQDCGYENHADFVGAWNVGERGKIKNR